MQNSLVTAVIPTRNRPELLLRAIASVLAQNCEQIEIVVVIDGPDATTEAALRAKANGRLRVIALPESVGGSDARNIGVQNARTEWIAFLDGAAVAAQPGLKWSIRIFRFSSKPPQGSLSRLEDSRPLPFAE